MAEANQKGIFERKRLRELEILEGVEISLWKKVRPNILGELLEWTKRKYSSLPAKIRLEVIWRVHRNVRLYKGEERRKVEDE